jgi:hypothetical protein
MPNNQSTIKMSPPTSSANPNADDIEAIRSLFLRQASAEMTHDIEAMDALLARSAPDSQIL